MSPREPVTAPAPSVDAELKALLRKVKLGRCLDTLTERLALARTESLPHADFLSLLLSDEVERRDRSSALLRARAAKLDPSMRIDTCASDTGAVFDRALWNELCSLRFLDDARGALLLGPVGVGKTHWQQPWGTWRSAADAASCSPAPTSGSAPSKRPGWTTASKPRCVV